MKSKLLITLVLLISMSVFGQSSRSFYDFRVETINGEPFDLSLLKGKKVLIVNTASKCGLTPQYEGLQALYTKYGGDNFTIIGFPANNFMGQEPGSNEEIQEFCQSNYGVEFPMMSKISVKGDDIHELYKWLTSKDQNGVMDSEVSWNFQKYLIDENGNLVDMMSPRTKPDDPKIIAWIEGK